MWTGPEPWQDSLSHRSQPFDLARAVYGGLWKDRITTCTQPKPLVVQAACRLHVAVDLLNSSAVQQEAKKAIPAIAIG